ncbi:MAG: hypothetical protein LUH20_09760 [Lachnospiraceae bacterium]|nr:hypothetical protein [Lachnospiraceae bacterium]
MAVVDYAVYRRPEGGECMSSISINTTKVLREQSSLQGYQKKVNRIADSVENVRLNLSFDLQSRDRIVKTLSSTESLLEVCKTDLGSMESVLGEVMSRYQETEERVKERSGQLTKSEITEAEITVEYSSSSTSGEEAGNSDDADSSNGIDTFLNYILDFGKKYLTIFNKFFGDDEAGLGSKFFSYFKNLFGFFSGDKSGLTGVSDWFDLASGSSNLWNSIYSYMKKTYDALDDKSQYNNLVGAWGDSSDAIGVGGSLFGLFAGIMDTADTLLSGETTIGERIASIIDGASGLIDVVKAIYNVGHTVARGLLFSATDLWATFAKTITSSVSQLAKSISNYLEDGTWDLGDTGATGVEMAVAGLTTMISALTLGIISPETFGTTAEDISSALEGFTEDLGTWIGELILSY